MLTGLIMIAMIGCDATVPSPASSLPPLVSASAKNAEASQLTDKEVADSVEFRKMFGLRSDEYWIRQVASDPGANRIAFPVPLSADEAAELARRNSLGREALKDALITYGEEHPEDWAGVFTDQGRGGLFVVQFSGHVDDHRAALAPILQPGSPVEFRSVARSLVELQAMAARLRGTDGWFRTIPAVLRSYGVDVLNNQVSVAISSIRPDAAAIVAEHFGWTSEVHVESDNTGAYLLANGRVRVLARDQSGREVPGLACEVHPDLGGGGEETAQITDSAGVCLFSAPATGIWIFLIQGHGLDRHVVAIGRAVVEPGRTSQVVIEVP